MRHPPRNFTWYGRKTTFREGTLRKLRPYVPRFKKVPYAIPGEGVNPYLFMIVREPLWGHCRPVIFSHDDTLQIPVSVVSEKYQLVQHHDFLNALADVLQENGFDLDQHQAQLCLTEYGERMWFSLTLPAHSHNASIRTYFDPGDGHPVYLKVNALNSVDKSTALEINLTWHRLVCDNGLMYGDNMTFKEFHYTDTLNVNAIYKFLEKQFAKEQFEREKERLLTWWRTKVIVQHLWDAAPGSCQIGKWLEKDVSKRWGIHAAARVYHIAKTGKDANFRLSYYSDADGPPVVKPPDLEDPPVKNEAVKFTDLAPIPKTERDVPGAYAPVRNAYDISQVLSWLANQQKTLQGRLKRIGDIPKLMRSLLTAETITLTVDE